MPSKHKPNQPELTQRAELPLRCFPGNAQPYQPFWNFRQTDTGTELDLNGVISEFSWIGDEITPKKFKEDLYAHGQGNPITIKLNSPGGDVTAAAVIRNIISEYPGEVTVKVTGMAASAAVMVAISGNRVQIMDSAMMMIHDPMFALMGYINIDQATQIRNALQSVKESIVPAYAERTGLSESQISAMMSRETWMSAREAVNYGFADEIIPGGQQPANDIMKNAVFVNCIANYKFPPAALLPRAVELCDEPKVEVANEFRLSDEQKREAEFLRERISKFVKE